MIILAIILAVALLLSVSGNLYLHHQNLAMESMVSRFRDYAIGEIEYADSEIDAYKETISKVDYRYCADTLESMAKNRGDGKYMVLLGQAEGLREAASFLRKESKRIGIK